MIAQVDEALCRLLRPHLPAGTQIRLDPPKPAWQTESQVRSVELFLFALHSGDHHSVDHQRAVRQNGADQDSVGEDGHRDAPGQGEGRDAGASRTGVARPRRCTLSYLVTARAAQIREEHDLLDAALHAMVASDEIPETYLPAHSNACLPVELAIADTDPTGLWTSLGMPARAGFVISVTAGIGTAEKAVKAIRSRASRAKAKPPADVTEIV